MAHREETRKAAGLDSSLLTELVEACINPAVMHPEVPVGAERPGIPWKETQTHLMVYRRVPLSTRRSSLLGVVMLWATDFFPLWKKVSGVQILLASRLFRGRIFMGPSNFSLSSRQDCRKKTSMVYSFGERGEENKSCFTQLFVANEAIGEVASSVTEQTGFWHTWGDLRCGATGSRD